MSIEEMCKTVLQGFEMEILDEFPVAYACNCSKERVSNALATLRPEEIRTLALEDGFMEAKWDVYKRQLQCTTTRRT